MTRALLLAAAALIATPVAAQHTGHGSHQAQPVKTKKKAPPKAVKKKATPTKPKPKAAPVKPADPHAGHIMPEVKADPHAGHVMPDVQADPHGGHDMPTMPEGDPHVGHDMPQTTESDPHAGHDMSGSASDIAVTPPPSEAFSGPQHAADSVFDPVAMASSRAMLVKEHGGATAHRLFVDQAEIRWGKGGEGYKLEADFWVGKDIDKLWLKGEAEGNFGEALEHGEIQALWSRAIAPFWDLQAGLRQDVGYGPDRTHLALGVQGIAPYWFEIDGAIFLSHKGEITFRLEGEYDLRITNRLIFQPRGEVELAAQNTPELGQGVGLSVASLGARLRYEITPTFAPYIGLEVERAFGRTADYRQRAQEDRTSLVAVTGVRFSF